MLLQTTVKRFDAGATYGFLHNPDGGHDVYAKKDRLKAFEDGKFREWREDEKRPRLVPGQTVHYCARLIDGRPQAIAWGIAPAA